MRKACKKCKIIFLGEKCPICGNADVTESWKGRVIMVNPAESEVAKKLKTEKEGEYAIKTK